MKKEEHDMNVIFTLLLLSYFIVVPSAQAQENPSDDAIKIRQSLEVQIGGSWSGSDVNPLTFLRYGLAAVTPLNQDLSVFMEGGVNAGYTQFSWSENASLTQHLFLTPDLRFGLKWKDGLFEPYLFGRIGTLSNSGWETDIGVGTDFKIVDRLSFVTQLSIQQLALTAGIRTTF